jgi:hypothetical protein
MLLGPSGPLFGNEVLAEHALHALAALDLIALSLASR